MPEGTATVLTVRIVTTQLPEGRFLTGGIKPAVGQVAAKFGGDLANPIRSEVGLARNRLGQLSAGQDQIFQPPVLEGLGGWARWQLVFDRRLATKKRVRLW